MFDFLRRRAQKNDPAYDALVAAFCLVAFADGHLHTAELARFIRLEARENPHLFGDEDKLMRDIVAFGKILSADYKAGREKALAAIAGARGDAVLTAHIMKAAQIAVIADNRITAAEEHVVAAIARTLGVPYSVE